MTPSSASTEAVVLLAKAVAEIRASHAQLQSLISQLLAKVDMLPATSPLVPPIAAVGVNDMSFAAPLSLCTHFPNINSLALAVIITHEFKAADLHKLDLTSHDKKMAYMFNRTMNQFKISHHAAREYKTLFSVLIPLQTHFQILAFHINNASATETFWAYMEQLLELVAEHKWSVVFAYSSTIDMPKWWLAITPNEATATAISSPNMSMPTRSPHPSQTIKSTSATHTSSNLSGPSHKFNDGKGTANPCP
ncbi:hypothetical protein C0989_007608 [Termitomyces sp. Mn162]|nr:hypothetical protein C0989_007608 [Termitomyces sp. Mn162]